MFFLGQDDMNLELANELQTRLTLTQHSDDEGELNDTNAENDGSSTTEEHGNLIKD